MALIDGGTGPIDEEQDSVVTLGTLNSGRGLVRSSALLSFPDWVAEHPLRSSPPNQKARLID